MYKPITNLHPGDIIRYNGQPVRVEVVDFRWFAVFVYTEAGRLNFGPDTLVDVIEPGPAVVEGEYMELPAGKKRE